jgi:hypothetical protein
MKYKVPAFSNEQDEHLKSTSVEVDPILPTWVRVSRIAPGAPPELDSTYTFTGNVFTSGSCRRTSIASERIADSLGANGLAMTWFALGPPMT